MSTIICTLCSREKNTAEGLLPARERYQSPRITKVESIAKESGKEFYILSGKFGLLQAEDPIPYYDHELKIEDVEKLVDTVAGQIAKYGITEIEYYALLKQNKLYQHVLTRASSKQHITFINNILNDD